MPCTRPTPGVTPVYYCSDFEALQLHFMGLGHLVSEKTFHDLIFFILIFNKLKLKSLLIQLGSCQAQAQAQSQISTLRLSQNLRFFNFLFSSKPCLRLGKTLGLGKGQMMFRLSSEGQSGEFKNIKSVLTRAWL